MAIKWIPEGSPYLVTTDVCDMQDDHGPCTRKYAVHAARGAARGGHIALLEAALDLIPHDEPWGDILGAAARSPARSPEQRREMCVRIRDIMVEREGDDGDFASAACEMIVSAGIAGDIQLCALAKDWIGEEYNEDVNEQLLEGAARKNHVEICDVYWDTFREDERFCSSSVLLGAACGGHLDLCKRAYKRIRDDDDALPDWGDLRDIIGNGASSGHRAICEYAHDEIVANMQAGEMSSEEARLLFVEMLHMASAAEDSELRDLAIEWCRASGVVSMYSNEELNDTLVGAAREGNRALCVLTRFIDRELRCGALPTEHPIVLDYKSAMNAAAEYDRISICKLIREWMYADAPSKEQVAIGIEYNTLFVGAAKYQHIGMCKLVHEWHRDARKTFGDRIEPLHLDEALDHFERNKILRKRPEHNEIMRNLIKNWIREDIA
jgi:hypothetical protein